MDVEPQSFFRGKVLNLLEYNFPKEQVYAFCKKHIEEIEKNKENDDWKEKELHEFEVNFAKEHMEKIKSELEMANKLHLIQEENLKLPDMDKYSRLITEWYNNYYQEKLKKLTTPDWKLERDNSRPISTSVSKPVLPVSKPKSQKKMTEDGEIIISKWKKPFIERGEEKILSREEIPKSFVKSNNYVRDIICAKLDYSHAYLYIVILAFRNQKTNKCFPSLHKIAAKMGISPRSISDKLVKLVDSGFLQVHSGTTGITNSYYFPLEDFYSNVGDKERQLQLSARKIKRRKFCKKKNKEEE